MACVCIVCVCVAYACEKTRFWWCAMLWCQCSSKTSCRMELLQRGRAPDPSSMNTPRWRRSTAISKNSSRSSRGVGTNGGEEMAAAMRLGDTASSARTCWYLNTCGKRPNRQTPATGSRSSRKSKKLSIMHIASSATSRYGAAPACRMQSAEWLLLVPPSRRNLESR